MHSWLAAKNLIITAAHCFKSDEKPYADILGIHSIDFGFSKSESRGRFDIELIKTHPDWPNENSFADIAFIKLKVGKEFQNAEIIPIYKETKNILNTDQVIAFGFTSGKYVYSSILNPSKSDLQTNGLTEIQAQETICIKDRMLPGDSGGPLYYIHNDMRYVIGSLASLNGCAAKNSTTTYTNIEKFIPWIVKESQIKIK